MSSWVFSAVVTSLLTIAVVGCTTGLKSGQSERSCIVVLGAFDIGSGTTKHKVARVDRCGGKVIKVLYNDSVPVEYKSDLDRGSVNQFSDKIQNKGASALLKLKEMGSQFSPKAYVGVATAAFRQASNGESVATFLSKRTGIPIKVISQEMEGELGYWAASSRGLSPKTRRVVWDIGGASMQISTMDGEKGLVIYKGKMASVEMRDWIIASVKKKSLKMVSSPNPVGRYAAERVAERVAIEVKFIPEVIRKVISSGDVEIIGIGGVHYHSITGQLGKKGETYSLGEVRREGIKRSSWSDKKIGGMYASTDVVNLILIGAFMDNLGIKKVRPLMVNNADGVLLHPEFFKEITPSF